MGWQVYVYTDRCMYELVGVWMCWKVCVCAVICVNADLCVYVLVYVCI